MTIFDYYTVHLIYGAINSFLVCLTFVIVFVIYIFDKGYMF